MTSTGSFGEAYYSMMHRASNSVRDSAPTLETDLVSMPEMDYDAPKCHKKGKVVVGVVITALAALALSGYFGNKLYHALTDKPQIVHGHGGSGGPAF